MNNWIDKSFICEYCGKLIIDSPKQFVSGCEHYPVPEENCIEVTFLGNIELEINCNENKI
jgi:hypothetical protein